jgi:hypothetical protein
VRTSLPLKIGLNDGVDQERQLSQSSQLRGHARAIIPRPQSSKRVIANFGQHSIATQVAVRWPSVCVWPGRMSTASAVKLIVAQTAMQWFSLRECILSIDTCDPSPSSKKTQRDAGFLSRIVFLMSIVVPEYDWQHTAVRIRSGGRGLLICLLMKERRRDRTEIRVFRR